CMASGPLVKHYDILVLWCQSRQSGYSKRRISTGRIRAADHAGTIVAAMQIAKAAAAIQIASSAFAWNGTYGMAYTSGFRGINLQRLAIQDSPYPAKSPAAVPPMQTTNPCKIK